MCSLQESKTKTGFAEDVYEAGYKREAEQYIIFGIRFRPGHCHVWYRNIWYDFKQN